VAERQAPTIPDDPVEAACALSVHTTFTRELQMKLDEFDEKVVAAREAHEAVMASAEAVQRTVETWVATWMAGGQ
jgi:hypothetical protein